jgi:hypothetical protein
MKMAVFRNAAQCRLAEVRRHFGGAYCLHHYRPDNAAVNTTKMSINFYQTTWYNIQKDSYLHARRRENLSSHLDLRFLLRRQNKNMCVSANYEVMKHCNLTFMSTICMVLVRHDTDIFRPTSSTRGFKKLTAQPLTILKCTLPTGSTSVVACNVHDDVIHSTVTGYESFRSRFVEVWPRSCV